METIVKFAKVHPNAKIPSKREEDMGFDIYACFDEDYIEISPHETKLIPTGIASVCSSGYGFLFEERGSTGSKGIAKRCGVIDSGFRDQWFVCLTNTTNKPLFVSKLPKEELVKTLTAPQEDGDFMTNIFRGMSGAYYENSIVYPYEKAIVQALVVQVPKVTVEEISYEELKQIPSERGMGQLGSSNK